MKIAEIYFEDRLVYSVEVTNGHNLCFNTHSTEIFDLNKIIASVPEHYLIIIKDKK